MYIHKLLIGGTKTVYYLKTGHLLVLWAAFRNFDDALILVQKLCSFAAKQKQAGKYFLITNHLLR